MSDNKIFSRAKAIELLQELDQIDKKSKNSLERKKTVVKKVVASITIGSVDMINMFPEMLKIYDVSKDDLELKKMLCFYFVNFGLVRPELGLRLLDLLYRDLNDSSVSVQALLLDTISSINVNLKKVVPHIVKILNSEHTNISLKRTACFSVARIFELDVKLATENDLLNVLNSRLYDTDVSVVTTLLTSLNDITEKTPSLQLRISKEHALSLLDTVNRCNEWSVIYILNSLMSFVPQSYDESLLIIDKVLPILQHENSSVVLNAVKVIVYCCNYASNPEDVIPTLSRRLGNALISIVSKPAEIQFLVLRNIILLLLSKPNLLEFDIKMFFCKYDDPIYVKDTKLEIIYLLADEDNIDIVLDELEEYATDVDIQMSRKLVRAIGNLAVKLEPCSMKCINLLSDLISNGAAYITQEGAIVLKNILRKYQTLDLHESVLNLMEHIEVIDEPESKNAVIWIIGNYCEIIPDAYTMLEDLGITFEEEPLDVQFSYLTAIVKFYLKFPKIGSDLVIRFLKLITEVMNNPDLRERGYFYWRLISRNDLTVASAIVSAPLPVISSENDKLDQAILEELELNIGSLLSIYLKPVNQIFRLSKPKSLPLSPALQPRSALLLKKPKKKPFKEENFISPTVGQAEQFENLHSRKSYNSSDSLRDSMDGIAPLPMLTKKGSKLSRKLSLSFKRN